MVYQPLIIFLDQQWRNFCDLILQANQFWKMKDVKFSLKRKVISYMQCFDFYEKVKEGSEFCMRRCWILSIQTSKNLWSPKCNLSYWFFMVNIFKLFGPLYNDRVLPKYRIISRVQLRWYIKAPAQWMIFSCILIFWCSCLGC